MPAYADRGGDFAQAVVYATDRRVSVIQEALGAVSASASSQAAIDYAYQRGIPVIASATMTPMAPKGRVKMITNGWRKDSNWDAMTR